MKSAFKIFALATVMACCFSPNAHGQIWQKWPDHPIINPSDPATTRVLIGTGILEGYGRMHIEHNSDGVTNAHLTLRETDFTDYARLQFMSGSGTSPARWKIEGTSSGLGQMNFGYHNGTSGADIMSILGDGRVGIGTATPSNTTKLHVKSTGGNPIYTETTIPDCWIGFATSKGYKGYVGVYSADNDVELGTGSNYAGNVNLVTGASSTGNINLVTKGATRLTVQSDGTVVSNDKICIGTSAPLARLTIASGGGLAVVPSSGTAFGISSVNSYLQFNSYTGLTATGRVGMNTTSFVPLSDNVMYLGASGKRWKEVWAGNGVIQTSDASVKKNIKRLPYGLKEVLQMKPVSYQWKDEAAGRTNLGFLAQEIEKIVPEIVVHADPDESAEQGASNATLGMKYAEIIPVLVNAIQEQQQQIQQQNTLLTEKDLKIENLETRLARLEALVFGQGTVPTTQAANVFAHTAQAINKIQTCFPNPVANTLTVTFESVVTDAKGWVSLFDIAGKEMKKVTAQSGFSSCDLFVGDLPSGPYFVKFFANGVSGESTPVVIAR